MVHTRTESTRYDSNSSFREIINKFQDSNIKKYKDSGKKKEKNFKTTRIRLYLIQPV